MKKIIIVFLSFSMLLALTCPVFAAEDIFIPSNGMEVRKAEMNSEDVGECVVVTSVTQAKEKSTDISGDARDLLVEVYDALSDGSMQLPVEGDFRYIELSDVSFAQTGCIESEEHANEEKKTKYEILRETDAELTMEFKLEIVPEGELLVLAYIDETWEIVEDVIDLGEGIVVCSFEDICPVVFIDRQGDGGSEDPTEATSENPAGYPIESAEFVPSITYKDGLEIKDIESNIEIDGGSSWGSGIDECVVVTSIAQAIEKTTDVSQDDRDLLLSVYEKLARDEMELPIVDDYVIRDLVDISFEYEDCRCIEEHGHKDDCLAQEGVTLTITFEMDVAADENVIVMSYVNEEWNPIKRVDNNGDGTVTCVFEDICPVAFVVAQDEAATENQSDAVSAEADGQNTGLWATGAGSCTLGMAALLLLKRRYFF